MPDEYTQDHSPLHATDQIPSRDTGPRERRLKRIFDTDGLTFGTGFPLTGINESRPPIDEEMERRPTPSRSASTRCGRVTSRLYWPRFGDAGQTFDTWPWLSHAAAHTDEIALGTASVVLPLRHPSTSPSPPPPWIGSQTGGW